MKTFHGFSFRLCLLLLLAGCVASERQPASNPLPASSPAGFWAYEPAPGGGLRALAGGASFAFDSNASIRFNPGYPSAFGLVFTGSGSDPEGRAPYSGTLDLLTGSDPAAWRQGLPLYREVVYRDLFPGVDLVWSWDGRRIESIFHLDPGADPASIRWSYSRLASHSLDPASGDLRLHTACPLPEGCTVAVSAPVAWQTAAGGGRKPVEIAYHPGPDGEFSFTAGAYNPGLPLTIDPTFTFETDLSGPGQVLETEIAAAPNGDLVVAGSVRGGGFAGSDPAAGAGSLAVYDPADGTWTPLETELDLLGVTALASDPGDPDVLYAGTRVDGVLKSTDAGLTWLPANTGLDLALFSETDYPPVNFVAVNPFDGQDLFTVLHTGGLYRSQDGGANWTLVSTTSELETMAGLTFDPNFEGHLLGWSARGMQRSTDGGETWAASQLISGPVWNIKAGADGTLYFNNTYSAYRILGQAEGLEQIYNTVNLGIAATAVDPADPERLAIIHGTTARDSSLQIVVSGDGGENWELANLLGWGSPEVEPIALHFDGRPGGDLFVQTAFGWSKVTGDGGPLPFGSLQAGSHKLCCAVDYGDGRFLVLARPQWDVFVLARSADGSDIRFVTYLAGGGDDRVSGMAVDPAGAITLAGNTASLDFPLLAALLPENESGYETFLARLTGSGDLVFSTLLGPAAGGVLQADGLAVDGLGRPVFLGHEPGYGWVDVVSQRAHVIRLSPDGSAVDLHAVFGGETDQLAIATIPHAIAVDAANDIYIAGTTNTPDLTLVDPFQDALAPNRTADVAGGDAFIARLDADTGEVVWSTYFGGDGTDLAAALAFSPDGHLIVAGNTTSGSLGGTDAGVQPSPSGGILALGPDGAWTPRNTGLPRNDVRSLAVDHADPDRMAAFVDRYGIYFSADGGASWQGPSLETGITPFTLSAAEGWMAAAGPESLYLSTDGGETWEQTALSADAFLNPSMLVLSPGEPLRIYTDYFDLGPVFSDDGGQSFFEPVFTTDPPDRLTSLAVSPADGSLVYAIGDFLAGYRSLDGGRNWELIEEIEFATRLFPDPVDPRLVYAWSFPHKMWFASTDSGETWSELHAFDEPFLEILPDRGVPNIFYGIDADGAIHISTDTGLTWELIAELPGAAGFHLYPPDPARIHALVPQGTDGFAGAWDPETGSLLWTTYVGGIGPDEIRALAVNGEGDIYLGGTAGPGFPTVDALREPSPEGPDAFTAKLAGDGSAWLYAVLLGGPGESVENLAVLSPGSVAVAGVRWNGAAVGETSAALESASGFTGVLLDASPTPEPAATATAPALPSQPAPTPVPSGVETALPEATEAEGEGSGGSEAPSGCGAGAVPVLMLGGVLIFRKRGMISKRKRPRLSF